jgi:hypothetical protein
MLGPILATVLLTACAGTAPTSDRFAPTVERSSASAGPHLYVADNRAGAIYRFSFVGGLPHVAPDETFAQLPGVYFLGIDASQSIYAATGRTIVKLSSKGTVLGSFSPNASITAFTVDPGGYTYVVPSNHSTVLVFSPKAFQSRVAKPIATLTATGQNTSDLVSIATDPQGRLYGAAIWGLDIFDRPHRTSSQTVTILPPHPKNDDVAWFSGALAFDRQQRLYANIGYQDYCQGRNCGHYNYWLDTNFDALSNWRKPGRSDSMIYAGECYIFASGRLPGTVTGMAVYGGYLDAACSGDVSGVWVYRADRFKRQHAVEQLTGLLAPTDAKVGP